MDDQQARERVARVEELLDQIEALEPAARDTATALVEALLDLYGEGLARLVGRVPEGETLADDELVSHLLMVHGMHPVPVEQRVRDALEEVRPYLESHGGNVELIGIAEGVVRLRLEGSCSGCPSSAMTLKLAIEDSIHKFAPEVEEIEAEDAKEDAALIQIGDAPPAPELIQLTVPAHLAGGNGSVAAGTGAGNAAGPGEWATAGSLPQLAAGGTLVKPIAGEPLLFLRVDGTNYAYRPCCAGCGESLEGAELRGQELTCSACGRGYDVSRAGRCTDAPELHLDPVPLLVDDAGIVRVALTAASA